MKLLGVIGLPVAHSLSPLIHTLWLKEAEIEASYDAYEIKPDDLRRALHSFGQDTRTIGFNITVPHKEAALELSNEASAVAKTVGAANTLVWLPSIGWLAENTDVTGFLAALETAGLREPGAMTALILGAGGAARAIAYALHSKGATLKVSNRTQARAETLLEECCDGADRHSVVAPGDLDAAFADADLVINTTSRGHGGDHVELPQGRGRLFFDISYGEAAAPQLEEAARKNWKTEDGLAMLVHQAADSFVHWFGIRPDCEKALKACRERLDETG